MSLSVIPLAITMNAEPQIMSAIIFITASKPLKLSAYFLAGVVIAVSAGLTITYTLATALVHPQRGLCVMRYSCFHEATNFRSGTVGKGARTARSRAALQGRLRDASLPDPSGQRPRTVSPEDSRKPRMCLANGEECHPSLQRARPRRPRRRLLAPQARPRRFRWQER